MRRYTLALLIFMLPILLVAQYPFRDANLKWGVIDTDLKILYSSEYDTIALYKNGVTIAVKAGKFTHLNTKGEMLYPLQFDSLGYFDYNHENSAYEGLAVAKKEGKYGLISPDGTTANEYPLIYDEIQLETPGQLGNYQDPLIFIFKKSGKYGCKINGQPIGKPHYDTIYVNFGNPKHLFFTKKKRKFFLSDSGRIVSARNKEFAFWAVGDPLYHVLRTLEIVEKEGKKGLRDIKTSKIEIEETYAEIQYIETEGFILITSDQKYGLVDNFGQRVLADEYKSMVQSPEGLLLVEEFSGRKGYLVNGKLLLP